MGIETALIAGGLAASVAGTATSVMGAIGQGRAAKASAKYNAAVARNAAAVARANKIVAERDAASALEDARNQSLTGQERVLRQDLGVEQQLGSIKAAQAASGLRGASHGRVVSTLRSLAAEDRAALRQSADADTANRYTEVAQREAEVVNLENQAIGAEGQAELELAQGRNAMAFARTRAFGEGLSGAANFATIALSPSSQSLWRRASGRAPATSSSSPWTPVWRP